MQTTNSQTILPLLSALSGNKSEYINTTQISASHSDVFIDSNIEEPQHYRELISLLFNASENDTINIYINSEGGSLDTALAIVNGLKNTNAHVTALIVGACHSAASIISMYCHQVAVLDGAYSMVHTASFGSVGSVGNVRAHTEFISRQVEKILDETYTGFLTKEELAKIKTGVELWFDADEIRARMEHRVNYLEQQLRKDKKKSKREKNQEE